MDEILWCYHSNETSQAVFLHGTIYLVQSSNFWVCGWNRVCDHSNETSLASTLRFLFFSILGRNWKFCQKFLWKGHILPFTKAVLIFYTYETDFLFILPRGFYITVYKWRHLTRILPLPTKPRLENQHFCSLNDFSLRLFLSCTPRTWYKVGNHSWGLTQETLKQAA